MKNKIRESSKPRQATELSDMITMLMFGFIGKVIGKREFNFSLLFSRLAAIFTFTGLLFLFGCGDSQSGAGGSNFTGPNQGVAILDWAPPTTNADGTPLTDLSGFKIYYGTKSGSYGTAIDVGNATTYTLTGLTPGTYYFTVVAYDSMNIESNYANEASKEII